MAVNSIQIDNHFSRLARIAIIVAVLVFISTLSFSYFFPELDFRITLLVTGLVFFGMPHGAMDIYILSQLLRSRKHLVLGLIAYISVGLPILFLWPFYPTFCFIFFLFYSLIHFADSDMQDRIFSTRQNIIEFLSRLNLPFCLPFIFYRNETVGLVKSIHPEVNILVIESVFLILGFTSLFFVILHTASGLWRLLKNFHEADISFIEPLVITLLFIFVQPLYAFGIYFCFIHSIKHMINIFHKVNIHLPLMILPYWLIPLIGLPILIFFHSENTVLLGSKMFQYIFLVLSSIALPHALLIRFAKSKFMIN